MPAVATWLKKNVTKATLGTAFGAAMFAPDVIGAVNAENKLTGISKALASIWFWTDKIFKPLRSALIGGWMVTGFAAMSKAIHGVVKDTGSLAAALQRLQSVRGFERQFAPLLGGLGAAKQRVAELLMLSQRGPFKFEDIAQASKDLEVLTRGAMSGAGATQTIGRVAIETGNSINDVAGAVGGFYSTLRAGEPIQGAVEQMRQMGIVSNFTANQLTQMATSGIPASVIFATLSDSLLKSRPALKGAADDLATVTAEHEKATEEMKVRFGAPWTQSEVQSTKNMTTAMIAITPALESVSQSLATVFTGFSNLSSKLAKTLAESIPVQAAITALGQAFTVLAVALVSIGTVMSAAALPALMALSATLSGNITAIMAQSATLARWGLTAAGAAKIGVILLNVFRAISVATIGTAVITGVVTLAGVLVNVVTGIGKAINSLQEMRRAFNESNDAIKEHIRTVQTVADQYEALTQAVNQYTSARRKVQELEAGKGLTGSTIHRIMQLISAYREAHKARKTLEEAKEIKGAVTPESQELARINAARKLKKEEEEFERQQAKAGPEAKITGLRERAKVLGERAARGERGQALKAQLAEEEATTKAEGSKDNKSVAERRTIITAKIAEAKKTLEEFQKQSLTEQERHPEIGKSAQKRIDTLEPELKKLQKQSNAIREQAKYAETPEGKQVAIEKLQRQLDLNKSLTSEQQARMRAQIASLQIEKETLQNERELTDENRKGSIEKSTQAELDDRSLRFEKIRAQAELEAARATGSPGERARKEFEITQRRIQAEQAEIRRLPPSEQNRQRMEQLQAELEESRRGERERIRGQTVTRVQTGLETAGVQARLAGQSEFAKTAEHLGNFISKFEELRQQFGDDEAKRLALEQEQTEISKESASIAGSLKPVADSLTRIGGGGGVGGPTGDPQLMGQQRQIALADAANRYLASIDQELSNQGAPEVGVGEGGQLPPGQAPETIPGGATILPPGAPSGPAATTPGFTPMDYGGVTPQFVPMEYGGVNPGDLQPTVAGGYMSAQRSTASVSIGAPGTSETQPIDVSGAGADRYFSPTGEIVSTLKNIDRSNKQANKHLGVISDSSQSSNKVY